MRVQITFVFDDHSSTYELNIEDVLELFHLARLHPMLGRDAVVEQIKVFAMEMGELRESGEDTDIYLNVDDPNLHEFTDMIRELVINLR